MTAIRLKYGSSYDGTAALNSLVSHPVIAPSRRHRQRKLRPLTLSKKVSSLSLKWENTSARK
jgi:hypothetical protein